MRWVAGATCPPDEPYDADIVILALDRPAETEAAIASALAQTGLRRHVVVLDQGSAPATLARFAAMIGDRSDITLLAAERNLGVAGGRNLATSFGHGRAIVGLDNDAEFASTTTAADLVAALDAAPEVAAIGCRIVTYATGEDDLSSWGYPRALLSRSGDCFDAVTFVGAGHAISRTAWGAAGGYDPALFFCWEEFDFCLRAIALGWRVRYRGDLVVRHKVAGERRVHWSGSRWFHFVRNRLYIGRKQGEGRLPLLARTCGYLVKGLFNGLARPTVKAIAEAYRMDGGQRRTGWSAGYIEQNDAVWRGTWLTRLRRDVLIRLR